MLNVFVYSSLFMSPPAMSPTMYGELLLSEPSYEERKTVENIINNCPKHPRETIDPYRVLALLRLEDNLGVPEDHKGLLPAVFCIESGLQDETENLQGDPVYDHHGNVKYWRALGPAQFHQDAAWPCMFRYPQYTVIDGIDWRGDTYFSAQCWVHRILNNLKNAEKKCGKERAWKVAEAAVSNIRRYNWRCETTKYYLSESKHWRLMKEWDLNSQNQMTKNSFIIFPILF